MTDPQVLDKAFHIIITRLVERAETTHYSDLARELGCSVEEARHVLEDLMRTGIPAWLHPGTDYIASFPPLNYLPTQYRVTVDGQQKWYAQ